MIYRKPLSPKGKLGAKKLFENNSYFSLKLMCVAAIGACCVIHLNFLNFEENLNLKFLFSYSSVLQTPL
jgi:hypothetical protein